MTKDWDLVEDEIKELSWTQKKRLDEVKKIMESKHGFKASTRTYRMKLAEWGLTRKQPRNGTKERSSRKREKRRRRNVQEEGSDDDAEGDDSDSTAREASRDRTRRDASPRDPENLETMLLSRATVHTEPMDTAPIDPNLSLFDENGDLIPANFEAISTRPAVDPGAQSGAVVTGAVISMLHSVLEADSQQLESIIMKHPNHINLPIGLPFEALNGRFFNHPAISSCVILQHPDQTLLDIACALPCGPVIWILLAHGAKGSKHPFGTDLAFHNAIKNGRTYTVQALLAPGRSKINGEPGVMWKPLLQAVYWNQPDIVRLLIDRGASVNDTSPWTDGLMKSSLQFCLDRRYKDYRNTQVRENCEKVLKILLNAGADVLLRPNGEGVPKAFETFLKPWQGDAHWIGKLNATEMECLEAFVRKGADLKTPFHGFVCTAPSCNTFEHQVLWHSTPSAARLLIDHAAADPDGNGANLLHEIVGSCPDAKRHPSDTLRDIEVLFKRGADPNFVDSSSFTPLRRCIERCPAVDIIPRLRLLLDAGADPELKHSNRLPPFVLAARTFEEPLRSQVMDFLVAKIKGRQRRAVYDDYFEWSAGYFPISSSPSLLQVQWYDGSNGDFNANIQRMIPDDVQTTFQRACFSVVSMNYLNAATTRAVMQRPLQMLESEKESMFNVIVQRKIAGLPEYRFEQDFVMGLLKPSMAPVLVDYTARLGRSNQGTSESDEILLPHQTPISSSAPSAYATLTTSGVSMSSAFPSGLDSSTSPSAFRAADLANLNDSTAEQSSRSRLRTVSISSTSSTSSAGSMIPTTTLIRWPAIGEPTRQTHIKRAKEAVLKYTCDECGGGNLLTKAELEKHGVEHAHSRECLVGRDGGCRRRFCMGSGKEVRGLELQ